MDPLTGLSVASNIVQFIDFSLRVVSKGCKIYRSIDGTLAENLDLEIVTNDLIVLQTKLQRCYPVPYQTSLSMDDAEAFKKLSEACARLAAKLLEKLNMAKAQGRFRKWKSLRQAVKSVWSKGDVEETASRLQIFRTELQLHLLVTLRGQVDLSMLEQSRISSTLDKAALRILQALEDNKDIFDAALVSHVDRLYARLNESETLVQNIGIDIKDTIVGAIERTRPTDADHVKLVFSAILAGLSFAGMEDRYEMVLDAHAKTFSWIFESKCESDKLQHNFIQWLRHAEGVFWITGKAASGKSTLMRYVYEHPALHSHLKIWGGQRRLVTAKFYFWNTGTSLQKSQVGLFRSLLYQVFKKATHLIEEAAPDLFQEVAAIAVPELSKLRERPSWRHWSLKLLKSMFHRLVEVTSATVMYCFFIDGLDEFDGDYTELTAFLLAASELPNVKFCLSSRPIAACKLHSERYPSLQLQDLTVGDISQLVHDRLMGHPRFSVLAQEEPHLSEDLITEIVTTASGVFLWVKLVVQSILEGLMNHDRISDLRKRLRDLPQELDDLYGHMLSSVSPPFYLEQGSRLIQLVYQSPGPLKVVELSFADDEDDNLAFKTPHRCLSTEAVEKRFSDIEYRLKSRCAGLLEIQKGWNTENKYDWTVQYLHVTVKEYLEKPGVWTKILNFTKFTSFDASLSLLRAKILMLKTEPFGQGIDFQHGNRNVSGFIRDTMELALQAENSTGSPNAELIEEFERTISRLEPRSPALGRLLPAFRKYWPYSLSTKFYEGTDSFLKFAVFRGLTLFTKFKIEQLSTVPQDEELLDCATWYQLAHDCTPVTQPALVAMLLKVGYDPNAYRHNSTPWRSLIKYIGHVAYKDVDWFHGPQFMLDLTWVEICRLFVLWGADVRVYYKWKDRIHTAWEVFDAAFNHLPRDPVLELRRLLAERGAMLFSEGRGSLSIRQPGRTHHDRHSQPSLAQGSDKPWQASSQKNHSGHSALDVGPWHDICRRNNQGHPAFDYKRGPESYRTDYQKPCPPDGPSTSRHYHPKYRSRNSEVRSRYYDMTYRQEKQSPRYDPRNNGFDRSIRRSRRWDPY